MTWEVQCPFPHRVNFPSGPPAGLHLLLVYSISVRACTYPLALLATQEQDCSSARQQGWLWEHCPLSVSDTGKGSSLRNQTHDPSLGSSQTRSSRENLKQEIKKKVFHALRSLQPSQSRVSLYTAHKADDSISLNILFPSGRPAGCLQRHWVTSISISILGEREHTQLLSLFSETAVRELALLGPRDPGQQRAGCPSEQSTK